MYIIWHGQSFFELTTKSRENGETKIVIDPYGKELGLRVPKIEAQILLVSHQHPDHANIKAVAGYPFLIKEPGEYEVRGVFIKGIPAQKEIVLYKIEGEGIKICHLSDLGQKDLTPEQLEQIGEVDILLIPVGGTYTIDAKQASNIVSQIEPRLVIPMHYKIPKLKIQLDSVDKFLKIMGAEKTVPEKKLKVRPRNLPAEETKIVVLTP